jgi:disulfide bond formation protein DsbB
MLSTLFHVLKSMSFHVTFALSNVDAPMTYFPDFLAAHPIKTVGLVSTATITTALAIERAGYPPCTLCLYQRVPYYALAGFFVASALVGRTGLAARLYRTSMFLILAILLVSACLGIFHAGVEFSLWDGPKGCSGNLDATNVSALLDSLRSTKAVSCTRASFWIFGLSLSVWNAIVSLGLAGFVGLCLIRNKRT